MPTPSSWYDESARVLKRERWHPCECSACDCEQAVKGVDLCPACRDGYHLIEDSHDAA